MSSLDQIREIIATTFEVDVASVTEKTVRADIASWDSLGHVNLMMALEDGLGLALEVEDFDKLVSVAAIMAFHESAKAA